MLYVAGGAVFLAVFLGVLAVGWYLAPGPTRDQKAAGRRLREMNRPAEAEQPAGLGLAGAVKGLGSWLAARNKKSAGKTAVSLELAGYRNPSALLYFNGLQLVLVVGLAAVGGLTAIALKTSLNRGLVMAAVGGAAGLVTPPFVLSSWVKKRQKRLRAGLPDALDVLVLSVEGGASLPAAVSWMTQEIRDVHPDLGAEFAVVEREMQLGLTAGEAFRAFADRCGLTEVRDLTAALIQSERYGASVAKALRAYADSARRDREMWAEEVAQKAAVKIMFPMLLCIFPAIFIVLLGPAAMQMSKLFVK